MELHQLRYFLAVVDEGTFTAAAHAVRVSQSGISTQLQKLERELGVALVDRSTRRVALTPAGARLVPYARAALAAVAEVGAAADDIRGLVTGPLRIGTVSGLLWPPLFDAISDIHAAHPGVDLRLREGTSDDLISGVQDGSIDVAVAAWADAAPEDVATAVIVDDPLVAVVADRHPWRARSSIEPRELDRTDLIVLPAGTGARQALDGVLGRVGSRRIPRWEAATPAFIQMLASRGVGVGVVSATTARGWTGITVIPIADPEARSRLGVVWRESPDHATRALLDRLPVGSS